MRTFKTPLALIATLGTAGAALSTPSAGTIAEVSAITGDVTLENGMAFRFEDDKADQLRNFKPGDTVAIDWIAVGDRMEGRQISPTGPAQANVATGTIEDLNEATGNLVLSNGGAYDFDEMDSEMLDNFSIGDHVSVHYLTRGDAKVALSVSPVS